ncbi:hypothetical protein C6503_21300 [Candidatus Poribacteria bacterium]|nr:MAG: hypothetical protein C6503_21300 [Candidatus Poribacteria bacterium]
MSAFIRLAAFQIVVPPLRERREDIPILAYHFLIRRRAIVHALKVMDNNIPDAAQALGIGRSTLYRKLKQYNLLS